MGETDASRRYFEIDTKIEGFEAHADPRKPSGTGISRSAGFIQIILISQKRPKRPKFRG